MDVVLGMLSDVLGSLGITTTHAAGFFAFGAIFLFGWLVFDRFRPEEKRVLGADAGAWVIVILVALAIGFGAMGYEGRQETAGLSTCLFVSI